MDSKKIIGFTCGTFDLFHVGHKRFLKRCRKYCDYLIVAVVTDYIVKIQKGQDRPIETLFERVDKVMPYADKVIAVDTFDMTSYLQICDVWLKGPTQFNMKPFDYPDIVVIPRTPGISTTKIIKEKKDATL